jgi:DNA invertase Pin-like site-specific DNA recombinase
MSADKIGPQHRARKAVLYVRQSSAHQVQHNRESQGLQYAMRDRLPQLGWSQIEIIDEDLGCSAASGAARAGFERMVAEVWPGQGRRGGRPGGLSLRAQQPRLAATR